MEKIKIGVSACLLGENVRYDGGHQRDRYLTQTLGRYFEWIPVCPEVEYGLPVPREAMRLIGDPTAPRLVTIRSGIDHTAGMRAWAENKFLSLAKESLCGFIFKSKSPSSGMTAVKVYGDAGVPSRRGTGIFAGAFMARFPFMPVEDDGRIHDPILRENFIERVFVSHHWQVMMQKAFKFKDLEIFHRNYKLLMMSHSPIHLTMLGRIIANREKMPLSQATSEYHQLLMEGLKLIATPKKQTNVLMHMLGYFKKQLTKDEKEELLDIIERYYRGALPLVVPVTMLAHYVQKFDEPYLQGQIYLNPHPAELMLRNHS
ncbi:MAG: DUF523 and DUF1722 domain-containing protein [Syntrophales bacterium]|jgi:uncharacterized protein YbgA (DUF1722 family)/uncharacterized protein YbbK (DUF523 family)|nr:DUF523 and DUF1722 domain-containing protein [Syntrophales bacterium]